jgi:hypothetical protein
LNKDIDAFTNHRRRKSYTLKRETRIMKRNLKSLDNCHKIVEEAISEANFEYQDLKFKNEKLGEELHRK